MRNKLFYTLLFLSFTISLNAQTIEDKNEIIALIENARQSEPNEILNNEEGKFLNELFFDKTNGFNFQNKKIGFISGPSAKTKNNKVHYFEFLKKDGNRGSLTIFNEVDKQKSGYDGVVIYWNKILPSKRSIFKTLKKKIKI